MRANVVWANVCRMSPTRREALAQLAALAALPLARHAFVADDPLDGTIANYQEGRRRGLWSAAEVTAHAIERCRTVGARYRAIDMLADSAVAEARASDERRRAGRDRGPMDGVPVFAKAIYDMVGLPTTGSSAEWARLFPDSVRRDAVEVSRMRAAGAVVLGKTAADDFAYHGNGTSSHTGQVLNPYDATDTRTPGGSSAGSAVAVATGMAFAGLGTDDGGSNRIPAQFTGVVGMKPTFGLVPRTGVIPTWPYLDTHGPLARSASDAALLLAIIAGADVSDPLALTGSWNGAPLASLRDDALSGVRLGLVDAHVPRAQMTAEALAMWDRAVSDLKAAGATVESFAAPITRANYRDAFAASAKAREDVAVNSRSPAPTANALYKYFAGRTDDPRGAMRGIRCVSQVLRRASGDVRRMHSAPRPVDGRRSGGTFVRSLAHRSGDDARECDALGESRSDGLPDDALQRTARGRLVAGCSDDPGLRQLARSSRGVDSRRARRRRNARAESVDRRIARKRRAHPRAGARVRASIATLRRAAAGVTSRAASRMSNNNLLPHEVRRARACRVTWSTPYFSGMTKRGASENER